MSYNSPQLAAKHTEYILTLYAPCVVLQYVIWTNKMHKILVIRLYFLLDALHVSDYISPSSGATL